VGRNYYLKTANLRILLSFFPNKRNALFFSNKINGPPGYRIFVIPLILEAVKSDFAQNRNRKTDIRK
jgi:hypothetical protein